MRVALVGALLLGSYGLEAQRPAPESFRVQRAVLDLSIDHPAQRLDGWISLELENWTSASSDRVSLLLNRLMDVSTVRDGAGAPIPFTQDVVRFQDLPRWQVAQIQVRLPRPVPPGGRTTLRIDYGGTLVGYTEVGFSYVRDRIDTAFTIIREDALAFPSIGGLSASANRERPRVPFRYDVSVRVPAKYAVATGGAAARTAHDDGTVTWRYDSRLPAPFLNICIAPFDTIATAGLRIFHFREDSLGARQVAASAHQALDLLAKWFGPQQSKQTVTIIEIPDGWGSQADLVAGIIQAAAAFRDPERLGEAYHELSHLWNVVDTESPSPRWNEGLATFVQDVLRERVNSWTGRGEAEADNLARVRRALAADSTLRTVPMVDYGKVGMTGRSYRVGALMFATLWQLVGERRFNAIVGGYYQTFQRGGSTRDFVSYANQTAGRNLKPFFDDWIYTTRWTDLATKAGSIRDLAGYYQP